MIRVKSRWQILLALLEALWIATSRTFLKGAAFGAATSGLLLLAKELSKLAGLL
ncbi:MAG: hypothetical protein AAGG01_20325 [Planctomycetota bacterium]